MRHVMHAGLALVEAMPSLMNFADSGSLLDAPGVGLAFAGTLLCSWRIAEAFFANDSSADPHSTA